MDKGELSICFIFNPSANRKRAERELNWLQDQTKSRWNDVHIHYVSPADDISELTKELAERFDVIVGCGGDGTISRVLNGAVGTDVTVGLLPIGSGNDFAKSIHLPKDLDECLQIIKKGTPKEIDMLKVSGDSDTWCCNTLGFGFDGWANYHSARIQKLKGGMIYVFGALKAAFTFDGMRLRLKYDQEFLEGDFLMVTACNGPVEGGNFKVAPQAANDDGWLDVLLIEKISLIRLLWLLPRVPFGVKEKWHGVRFLRCRELNINSDIPVAVHCDGELLGTKIKDLNVKLHHKAVKVYSGHMKM
jgi:YegS/Rv2252/BmrU family lipid kinase